MRADLTVVVEGQRPVKHQIILRPEAEQEHQHQWRRQRRMETEGALTSFSPDWLSLLKPNAISNIAPTEPLPARSALTRARLPSSGGAQAP